MHQIRPLPFSKLLQAPAVATAIISAEALAAVLSLAPGLMTDRWVYFGLASLATQWIVLLTLLWLYWLRRSLNRLGPYAVAYAALALMLASTAAVWLAIWWLTRDIWSLSMSENLSLLVRCLGISFLVGSLAATGYAHHTRMQDLAVSAKQAQLEALRARIRPHFLFNTLNTGAALVHHRPEQAEQLLLDLADLFRAALSGPERLKLDEEVALARRYLEIEQMRFGERLKVEWDVPDILPLFFIPSLTLQPLAENAIRHGIEPSTTGGIIKVVIREEGEALVIEVRNKLLPMNAATNAGSGVGLQAVIARLEAMTDSVGHLTTQQRDDEFIASIRLSTIAK